MKPILRNYFYLKVSSVSKSYSMDPNANVLTKNSFSNARDCSSGLQIFKFYPLETLACCSRLSTRLPSKLWVLTFKFITNYLRFKSITGGRFILLAIVSGFQFYGSRLFSTYLDFALNLDFGAMTIM